MAVILSALSHISKPTLPAGALFKYQKALSTRQIYNGFLVGLPKVQEEGPVPYEKSCHRSFAYESHHSQSSVEHFPKFDNGPCSPPTYVPPGYTELRQGFYYLDLNNGYGESPREGQKVKFNYEKLNYKGERLETHSSKKLRIGRNDYGTGFDDGLRSMKKTGRRRLVIPPNSLPPRKIQFGPREYRIFEVTLESIEN